MKITKKTVLVLGVSSLAVIVLVCTWFFDPFSQISINRRSFKKAVLSLSDDIKEVAFDDLASFDWDYVYSFDPYISEEEINNILGFNSGIDLKTMDENTENLIFVNDNEVICYIAGFSGKLKFAFDLGEINNRHVKISKSDQPIFFMKVSDDGTKYFSFDGTFRYWHKIFLD